MLWYFNMSLNVQISKNQGESPSSILRRFTKKVQEWGGLNKVREKRYSARAMSHYKLKQSTLKKIKKNAERMAEIKLGKFFNTQKSR